MSKVKYLYCLATVLLLASFIGVKAQNDLLFEDFNSTSVSGALPQGWDTCRWSRGQVATPTSGYLWKSDAGGVNYSRCAYLFAMQSYTLRHGLMTPPRQFDATKLMKLSFDLKNYTTTATGYTCLDGDMDIYVTYDNGATIADTVALGVNTGSRWQHYEYPLTNQLGASNVRILFIGKADHHYYLDNVRISEASQCKPATDIYVTSLSSTTASFSWNIGTGLTGTEANPTGFIVKVYDASTDSLVLTSSAGIGMTFTATGLSPATSYRLSIASDCGSTLGSGDAAELEFQTCSSPIPLPYLIDFESGIPAGSFGTNYEHNQNAGDAKGNGSLKLTATSSKSATYISPLLGGYADSIEVDLLVKPSIPNVPVKLGIISNPYDDGSFEEMVSFNTGTAGVWQAVRFNTAVAYDKSPSTMFCIVIDNVNGSDFTLFLDSVHIHHIPSCIRPENLSCTARSHNSISISWNYSTATNYLITASHNSGIAFQQQVSAPGNSYTITGVAPNTNYLVSVKAVCSPTDESEPNFLADSIRTLCDVADTVLMFDGAEDCAVNTLPDCWSTGILTVGTGSGSDIYTEYPFYSSSTRHSGSQGFQLRNMKSGTISYLSSQKRDFGSVAGKYTLRIWVNRTMTVSSGEGIDLWITDNVGDTVGGDHLGMVSRCYSAAPAEQSTGWYRYDYIINHTGLGYVTVIGKSKNAYSTYFDDIEIFETPSCAYVRNLSVSVPASRSIDLTWSAGGSESQWLVGYTASSSVAPTVTDTIVVSSPNCSIQGLQPATTYSLNAFVRAICSPSDTSEAITVDSYAFTTACSLIDSLPYRTGFEDDEIFVDSVVYYYPICWTRYNDYRGTQPNYKHVPYINKMVPTYARTGSNAIYGQVGQLTADNSIMLLPQIDTSAFHASELRMKFWAKESNSAFSQNLYIGVMSDPDDYNTWIPVDTVFVGTTDWTEYKVVFNGYKGTGSYIGINFAQSGMGTGSSSFTYIDDLTLELNPKCADIDGGVTILALSDTSVTICVTDSTIAGSWQYAIGVSGSPVSSLTPIDVTSSSVTINGLAAETEYDLYARSNCGNQRLGNWTEVKTFKTTKVPAAMPYVCGFEDNSENANWVLSSLHPEYYNFTVGSDANGVASGLKAMYVTNGGGLGTYTYPTTASNGAGRAFASRVMRFDSKGYQVELKWKSTGGQTVYDYGRIFLTNAATGLDQTYQAASAGLNIIEAAQIDTGIYFTSGSATCRALNTSTYMRHNPDANGWCSISYYLDMTGRAGTYNLVLMWNQDASGGRSSFPLAVDDISITELSCIPPSSITTTPTPHTVGFDIRQPEDSTWEIIVDSLPIATDSITDSSDYLYRQVVSNNLVTVPGLSANTQYYYTVRTFCSGNDTSAWRLPLTVQTLCDAAVIPYTEGFENASSLNCWNDLFATEGSSLSKTTARHKTGTASLMAVNSFAVSPEMLVDSLHHYQLTGFVYSTVDSASLDFVVGTDQIETSSMSDPVATEVIPQAGVWKEFTVFFDSLSSPDYSDFKYGRYIGICCGENTFYFDDLRVSPVSACVKPTHASVTNVGEYQFDVAFADNAGATQWIVSSTSAAGYVQYDTISSDTATITVPYDHTEYTVRVAALCSPTSVSDYAEAGVITTKCAAFELPYSTGFEATDGWSESTAYVEGQAESVCWATLNIKPNGADYPYYKTSAVRYSGSKALYAFSTPPVSKEGFLILPAFNAPTNKLDVVFYGRTSSKTSTDKKIEFGYMTDITNESTFVKIAASSNTTTFTRYEYDLTTYQNVPATARLAFRITKKSGGMYIDDLSVTRIRTCSAPNSARVVELTATSVKMLVSDADTTHSSFEYVCVSRGASPNSVIPLPVPVSDTVAVTGLSDGSEYDFYVRAVCGEDDESDWVRTQFRTDCLPFTVTATNPFLEDFEDYAYGDVLNGSSCYVITGEGSTTSNKFKVYPVSKPSTTSTSISYYAHDESNLAKCAYLYATNSAIPDGVLMSRGFVLEAGKLYSLSAFFRAGSNTRTSTKVCFLLGTDTLSSMTVSGKTAPATFYDAQGRLVTPYNTQFEEMKRFFTVPVTGTYSISILASNGSPNVSAFYCLIDDWSLSEFDGCIPSQVALDSVSGTSAYFTISDTLPGQTWEYMLNDTAVGLPTAVQTTHFQVTGLMPSTANTLYLRTLCSSTNRSEWVSLGFTSACGSISAFPYNQGFEGQFLPTCWTQLSTNGTTASTNQWVEYTSTAQTYIHGGSNSASLPYIANTNTALVTNAFDFSGNPYGYEVSFWIYRYSTSSTSYGDDILRVLVYDQPITAGNVNYATEVLAIPKFITYSPVESAAGYYKYDFEVPAQFLDDNVYLAFYHTVTTGYATLYLDDIEVTEMPACRKPGYSPAIIGTTKNTASATFGLNGRDSIMVGWAHYATGVSYVDIIDSIVVASSSFTINGLDSASTYALFARYLCGGSEASDWSPYATCTTQVSDCFTPYSLAATDIINDHHASFSWFGVPNATAYQYVLLLDSVAIDSGLVAATATSVVFDSLSSLSNYILKVRAVCSEGPTDWASVAFTTTAVPQAVPYSTDFEDASRDGEWHFVTTAAASPNRYVIGTATSLSGNRSLYVSDGDSAYGYQVATVNRVAATSFSYAEVLLPLTSGEYAFSYDWKCYGEGFASTSALDYARLFLVPSGVAMPSLTSASLSGNLSSIPGVIPVSANVLNNQTHWTSSTDIVSVSDSNLYCLVVAWTNDGSGGNQPPFAIDNLSVERFDCSPLQNIIVAGINDDNATMVVNRRPETLGTSMQYGIALSCNPDSIVSVHTVASSLTAADTVNVNGLQPETQYYFFARTVCDSASVSPWIHAVFTTPATPKQLPFICGFESASDNASWSFANSQYSWFVTGGAVSHSGQKSLYVTDLGSRYHYSSPGTPTTANGTSYASVPLAFGPATYEIEFDWMAAGVPNIDYGRALLAPANVELSADVLYTGLSSNSVPEGWIALDGSEFSGVTSWQHRYATVSFRDSVTMNLLFVWHQNYVGEIQSPLAIDDIKVKEQTCSPIVSLTCNTTTDSAYIVAHHSNGGGQVFWHIASDSIYSDTIGIGITDSVIAVSNLGSNTRYYVKVGVVCGGNDTSHLMSYCFKTDCGILSEYPYFEGFENMAPNIVDTVWYKDNCWTMNATSSMAYSYPSDLLGFIRTGNRGLYVYNGLNSATQYLTFPVMDSLNGKTLSFYHLASSVSTAHNTLTIGYFINGNFVSINEFTDKSLVWSNYATTLNNLPAGARLAFRFVGPYHYSIDDIRISKIVQGNTYNDTVCFNASYNKHGFSFANGSLFPGDTTFTKTIQSQIPGVADSITTVNIHVYRQIAAVAYDTVCSGTTEYVWGSDTIFNPTTSIHTQTFSSACGCDSTVALNLYVVPGTATISTSICEGDSFSIGGEVLKTSGTYTVNVASPEGCNVSTTVNLSVVDSVQVTNAAICQGDVYRFEGASYTQTGVYRHHTVSALGCDVVKVLNLTVYKNDSTINATFCQGGSITIAGVVISSDTTFDVSIVNPGVICSTTYHITATSVAPIPSSVYDNACEGHLYSGYGLTGVNVTNDTAFYIQSRTSDGLCDSLTIVNIRLAHTTYGYESATMRSGDQYVWHDNSYTEPGTYTDTLHNANIDNCDSIVTLTLSIDRTGVDNVSTVNVRIVPNPVTIGNTSLAYADAEVTAVEVLNSFGQVVSSFIPTSTPIEITNLNVSGLYYVRLFFSNGTTAVLKLMVN